MDTSNSFPTSFIERTPPGARMSWRAPQLVGLDEPAPAKAWA
jgi:hypothetical protein